MALYKSSEMINLIKRLLGLVPNIDYRDLVNNGAQIIDVRTPGEFRAGHIVGSVNIPLQNLRTQINRIRKDKPVITCCASGMRSASAKSILAAHGFVDVHNGGGWLSLQSKLS
jgi:rhodanese-related sulfurtransferase